MLSAHPRCRFCWPVPSLLASRSCRGARTEGLHWWPAERTTPKHTRKTIIYCHGHAEAPRENQVLLFIPDSVVWGKTPVFWASSICQSRNVRGLPEKRCDARSRFSHVFLSDFRSERSPRTARVPSSTGQWRMPYVYNREGSVVRQSRCRRPTPAHRKGKFFPVLCNPCNGSLSSN